VELLAPHFTATRTDVNVRQATVLEEVRSDAVSAKTNKVVLAVQLGFVLMLCCLCALNGIFPPPEFVFILLLVSLLWHASSRAFFLDFIPFLLVLLSYHGMRGFADDLNLTQIHVTDLIAWERLICGGAIPASLLQQALRDSPIAPIANVAANTLYMSHFVTPLVIGYVIWQKHRNSYWNYLLGFMVLCYTGFVTYVVFPAAPPWWATYYGYLDNGAVVLTNFVLPVSAMFTGPNPVAAMPSLHAAFPTYIALYTTQVWGRRGLWLFLLPIGVSLSAIYLGHHYVVDVLAGFLYAAVAFGVAYARLKYSAAKSSRTAGVTAWPRLTGSD
jgi:membrane-associated phospholipid phosphatase